MAVTGAPEKLRMVKSAAELEAIQASVDLNSRAFEEGFQHFQPSMTEVELAAEIDYRMRRLGADSNAFATIVASGERTALPHAHPGGQPIEHNQLCTNRHGCDGRRLCQRHNRHSVPWEW